MKISDLRNLLLSALLVILGAVLGYQIRGGQNIFGVSEVVRRLQDVKIINSTPPPENRDVDFSQFWEVWKILERDYLDPEKLDKQKMTWGAIRGLTSSLEDPYTMYLPPTDQKRSEEDLQGSFFGVGIQLGYIDGTLAVQTPIKGSPADKAGVKAKDLILHVEDKARGFDEDTQGWSLVEAVDHIRGDKGSIVTLTLFRKDDPEKKDPFKVDLARGEIIVPSAEVKYIDQNGQRVALITLSRFGERTVGELDTAIRDIQSQQPRISGIILDMRNNPGGFLDGAIDIASEFIKTGPIVTQKGKYATHTFESKGTGRLESYPLVVVVNGGSASASEIVAGALRDRRQAELIGEKTFGKGTVQDALRLEGGAGLHVTIARWLLPGGDWIHKEGIPVQIELKDDEKTPNDEVIDKAVEELTKR